MKILVGADPEVFVRDRQGDLLSAHGMIRGTKEVPHPVNNGAVQVDGMALEFNINPAATEEDFLYNVSDVLDQLQGMIGEERVLDISSVAEFGEEMIEEQPKEAKILGCDPDYNAWTDKENIKPDESLPFRTAAGHIHVGWTDGADVDSEKHRLSSLSIIKQLDFFLGLPSLIFDGDAKRRSMYGKAGAFRPKSYGAEYRTLSNQWLKSEQLMKLVYNNVHEAVKSLMSGNPLVNTYGDIQSIINNSDRQEAIKIMDRAGITYQGG